MSSQALLQLSRPGTGALVSRLFAYGAAILLLGGMVHISVVLMVPYFANGDGWSRLSDHARANEVMILDRNPATGDVLPGLDPLFLHVYCRVSINDNPARLTFAAPDQYWSLALYNRENSVIFSLNDRTIEQGKPEFLVVTPAQNARLKEGDPERFSQSIVLESEQANVVVMLRFYTPTARRRAAMIQSLEAATCGPLAETAEPVG